MTAEVISQILCDCTCVKGRHGCHVVYPDQPAEGHPAALRMKAHRVGWRVVGGKDLCPPCRQTVRTP